MRKYMSTGYAWIPDNDNTAKTQLHIYTFDDISIHLKWFLNQSFI